MLQVKLCINKYKYTYCERTSRVTVGSVEKRYIISRQACILGVSNSDFSSTDTIVPK